MIEELHDHIIVCGYGRVGRRAAEELRQSGVPVRRARLQHRSDQRGARSRATSSSRGAAPRTRISPARGSSGREACSSPRTTTPTTCTSRSRRSRRHPDLMVIARASTEEAERKLRLAGADRVVTPYATAGREMAKLMVKPQVAVVPQQPDVAATDPEHELRGDPGTGRRAAQSAGRSASSTSPERTGANIVALRKEDGGLEVRPTHGRRCSRRTT